METLSDRQEPEAGRSSLDNEYISARKRYRRVYHRVMSGLERDGQVRFITLTSSPQCGDFQRDFRRLHMRLKRRGVLVDYIRVNEYTAQGRVHAHIIYRGSYIEQSLLSFLWGSIHNSPVVDIRRVRGKRELAGYLSNYLAKSPAGRYSYSWGWVWRGLARDWELFKKLCYVIFGMEYPSYLTLWTRLVKLKERPEEVGTWLRASMSGLNVQGVRGSSEAQLELRLFRS